MTAAHNGQSMLAVNLASLSPFESTSFILPPVEQTICKLPGLTMVEAIAEPRNKANHTSTRRVMNLAFLRVCMGGNYVISKIIKTYALKVTISGQLLDQPYLTALANKFLIQPQVQGVSQLTAKEPGGLKPCV